MSPRADYTRSLIFKHYREKQRFPLALKMHPVFLRHLMSEPEAFRVFSLIGAARTFEGFPIEQTTAVHAVEVVP
jgi:hypothetical protein